VACIRETTRVNTVTGKLRSASRRVGYDLLLVTQHVFALGAYCAMNEVTALYNDITYVNFTMTVRLCDMRNSVCTKHKLRNGKPE
jgi:hypothetical protein